MNTEEGKKQSIFKQLAFLHRIGVCCFSSAGSENILMWSHYAQKHTGICLEFNMPSNGNFFIPLENAEKHPLLDPITVKYDHNKQQLNFFTYTLDDNYRCLSTKSPEWEYEAEYRSMCMNYVGIVSYHPWTLSAVIAGCKMLDKDFEELVKTVNKLKFQPRLYRAKMKELKYGIDLIRVI